MRFEITGHLSDPEAAWEAVADTDWMNREAGAGKMLAYEVIVDDTDYPQVHGALAGPLGTRLAFTEDGNRWVRGRYFEQERTYSGGPLERSYYRVSLESRDGGVIPRIVLDLTPRYALLSPAVRSSLKQYQRRWQGVLDGLPHPGEVRSAPLRELGPIAKQIFDRWRQEVPSVVADRVLEHLRRGRPIELQQMRAFALADRWRLDRDEVLGAYLEGARSGMFELYWSVRCPRCSAQTNSVDHLGNLADHARCASCRIGFDADLSSNVEVLFAPHPSIVERIDESFCTLFPMGSPSIEASVILAPGDRWSETVLLDPGKWRIGSGGERPDVGIEVERDGDHHLSWDPEADGEISLGAGEVEVELDNPTDGRVRVQLARLAADPGSAAGGFLAAGYLSTHPGFRRSMGHQVLAPDTRISTRSVTLVFTDLTGSTAMYEEIGDAAAYALVRDHFRVLRAAVEGNGGTVVKTIGDAVMASFPDPLKGAHAALQMVRDFDLWIDARDVERKPRLTVGMHTGPALVVHTDQAGFDYFGQTVNIAARAESVAEPCHLVYTQACADWPGFAELLEAEALAAHVDEHTLKGLSTPMPLHKVDLGRPT